MHCLSLFDFVQHPLDMSGMFCFSERCFLPKANTAGLIKGNHTHVVQTVRRTRLYSSVRSEGHSLIRFKHIVLTKEMFYQQNAILCRNNVFSETDTARLKGRLGNLECTLRCTKRNVVFLKEYVRCCADIVP